jgi:hypothetical protein
MLCITNSEQLGELSDILRDSLLPLPSVEYDAEHKRLSFSVWTAEDDSVVGFRRFIGPLGCRILAGRRWLVSFEGVTHVNVGLLPTANQKKVFSLGSIMHLDRSYILIETYDGLELTARTQILQGTALKTGDVSEEFSFRRLSFRLPWSRAKAR